MLQNIGRIKALVEHLNRHIRVEGFEGCFCRRYFWSSNIVRRVNDLTLKVAQFYCIVIDQTDSPYTGSSQVEGCR